MEWVIPLDWGPRHSLHDSPSTLLSLEWVLEATVSPPKHSFFPCMAAPNKQVSTRLTAKLHTNMHPPCSQVGWPYTSDWPRSGVVNAPSPGVTIPLNLQSGPVGVISYLITLGQQGV